MLCTYNSEIHVLEIKVAVIVLEAMETRGRLSGRLEQSG
jgi:hypothetical protein